jgi:hypothetical protein
MVGTMEASKAHQDQILMGMAQETDCIDPWTITTMTLNIGAPTALAAAWEASQQEVT